MAGETEMAGGTQTAGGGTETAGGAKAGAAKSRLLHRHGSLWLIRLPAGVDITALSRQQLGFVFVWTTFHPYVLCSKPDPGSMVWQYFLVQESLEKAS